MKIKLAVVAINSNGSPEILAETVEVTQSEYNEGRHYELVESIVDDQGYDFVIAVDENDDPIAVNAIHGVKALEQA